MELRHVDRRGGTWWWSHQDAPMAWLWAVSEGEGQRRCLGSWPERGWAVASSTALGGVLGDFAHGLLQEGRVSRG